jgi:predicted nucleic acid-binding protein
VIHLHTSFLVRALVPGSGEDRRLRSWLERRIPLAVSAIAWAEFLCGPISSAQQALAARVVGEPVPFDAADARLAASLFNGSGRRRGTLADCMIAAVAIRAEAQLATADPRDFAGFQAEGLGLKTDE